jgi:hypothetical protein
MVRRDRLRRATAKTVQDSSVKGKRIAKALEEDAWVMTVALMTESGVRAALVEEVMVTTVIAAGIMTDSATEGGVLMTKMAANSSSMKARRSVCRLNTGMNVISFLLKEKDIERRRKSSENAGRMAKAAASGLVMMTSVRAGVVTEAEERAVTDASTEKTDLSKNAGSTMMRNKYYRDVAHVCYVSVFYLRFQIF